MDKMKAVVCTRYGAPEDVLKMVEVKKPTPKDDEVLIKIVASALNSGDVRVRSLDTTGFLKFIMRFVLGFKKPRNAILGVSFAGIVVQTGKKVKDWRLGDDVFGMAGFRFGAHAEYIALPANGFFTKKPANATFEEAAALPFGGHTAIYFLEKAGITFLKKPAILIYGATGSVGMAAIQIAHHYQAQVTAVCSEAGKKFVNALDVDDVICYDREDFTKTGKTYDIVFDTVGKTSKKRCRPLLSANSRYITVADYSVAVERKEQLTLLRALFDSGKYKACIDRVYTLDELVEAHKYVDTSRKKGNVVIRIAE